MVRKKYRIKTDSKKNYRKSCLTMNIITPINSNTALHNSGKPLKESIDLFNGNPIPLLLKHHIHPSCSIYRRRRLGVNVQCCGQCAGDSHKCRYPDTNSAKKNNCIAKSDVHLR